MGVVDVLNGQHLKISGNQFPPYIFSSVKNGVKTFGGANYEIIRAASLLANFTFDLDAPAGKGTGAKLGNGTWVGLFADIYYKKSDLAIVLAHTPDRNGLVDFTTSFGSADLVFTTALPSVHVKAEAILYLFTAFVWTLVAASFFFVTLAAYLTLWLQRGKFPPSLLDLLFLIFKILMEQSNRVPQGLELIVGLYLLYVIIIGTGYKSNLLASLSFPYADLIPSTFQELADRADYQIYFDMSGTAGYNYFMQGNSPMIVNIRSRFMNNVIRKDPAKCVVAALLEKNTACIGWNTVLDQVIGRNLTLVRGLKPLFTAQESITRTWVTIGLEKNSKYTNAFSFITASLYQTGIISKWHRDIVHNCENQGLRWMRKAEADMVHGILVTIVQSRTKEARGLTMDNMSVCFMLLCFGLLAACIAFSVELLQESKARKAAVLLHFTSFSQFVQIFQDSKRKEGKLLETAAPSSFDYSNYPSPEYATWG